MIVACGCYGKSQQVLIIVNSLDNCCEEQQELCIFSRCLAWGEKILTLICGDRPVVVLAGTVHASKRLFVEQTNKSVTESNFLHYLHCKLVVVGSDICSIIDRRKFMLCRSNFIVLCLGKDAELPELSVQISHILCNSRLDRAEIVIVHFLSLGRHSTEESSSCHNEVFSLLPHITVNKEVFLLGTNGGLYTLYACVSEKF